MLTQFARTSLRLFALGAAIMIGLRSVQAEEAQHSHAGPAATQPAKAEFNGDPYLLPTDPVTGDKLPKEPVLHQHEGRELRFADSKSVDKFKADPTKYLPKVDERTIKQQLPFYPLETCPVSGEKLGSMGKPVDFIYRNRLVRFCCGGCIESFQKGPSKYIAKLNEAAIAKQKPTYPLDTCVISGNKLGEMGKPDEVVIGNRLVRLCCPGCEKSMNKDPLKSLKTIDEAAKKKTAQTKPASVKDAPTHQHDGHNEHGGHGGHHH